MLDIEGSTKIARSLFRKAYLESVNIPVYTELARLIALHHGRRAWIHRSAERHHQKRDGNDSNVQFVCLLEPKTGMGRKINYLPPHAD